MDRNECVCYISVYVLLQMHKCKYAQSFIEENGWTVFFRNISHFCLTWEWYRFDFCHIFTAPNTFSSISFAFKLQNHFQDDHDHSCCVAVIQFTWIVYISWSDINRFSFLTTHILQYFCIFSNILAISNNCYWKDMQFDWSVCLHWSFDSIPSIKIYSRKKSNTHFYSF